MRDSLMNILDRIILEGGASGHMSHLFEDFSLTIQEIKDLVGDLLSGKIELHEKTDGINLVLTYKDGHILASRNKETLRNPMSVDQIATMFKGEVRVAFIKTMEDIELAVSKLSEEEITSIFNNGYNFMSVEIIYPPLRNVIDYGNKFIIQLHGINKYDEKWNKIGEDKELAQKLYSILQSRDALNQKNFTISGPNILKLTKNLSVDKIEFNTALNKVIKGYATDKDTLQTYVTNRWKAIINPRLEKSGILSDLDDETKDKVTSELINRYTTSKLTMTKTKLTALGGQSHKQALAEFIELLDANKQKINREIIAPIELLIIKAGTAVLNNVSGIIAASPNKSIKKIADELDKAVNDIKTSTIPDGAEKLEYYLNKINKIGKDNIAPVEGVVFIYKGKPYKLTGLFGAINNIIGLIKYRK